jgi:acetyltransferase-like isoleucine patch superfamily enzyme
MRIRRSLQILTAFLPFGKNFIYTRIFGAEIGRGVRLKFGAILLFEKMQIGDGVSIGPLTIVDAQNIAIGLRSRIGSFVRIGLHSLTLGPSCTVNTLVSVRGNRHDPRSNFSAGAECWIFDYCYIDVTRPVRIGRNVGIGGGTYVFTHGFWLSQLHGYPVSFGEVTIENDAWLPWACFVMPGVRIGAGCVIGARSLITRDVPPGALVAGSPAKVIRERVAADVSVEERVGMLVSHTRAWCTDRGTPFAVSENEAWTVIDLNGQPEIAIARTDTMSGCAAHPAEALRVVHRALRELQPGVIGAAFSTATFQCTPRKSMRRIQAEWLQSLRSIGTRHYPLDEVPVEGQDAVRAPDTANALPND